MSDDIGEEWEEDLSSRIDSLTVMDKETGEVWYQEPGSMVELSNCSQLGAIPKKSICKISAGLSSCKRWRIPREYSKLGSPTDASNNGCLNETMKVTWKGETKETQECKTGQLEVQACDIEPTPQALVASMPLLGKLPSFCRKRQASSLVNVPEKKQDIILKPKCKVERFLEKREGLLFMGRLLLVLLALLSPGFVLPIIFTLKVMCHFQIHCHNEGCSSEMIPILYGIKNRNNIPGYFLLRVGCRLCRDQRKSDKIFRLHSQLKAEHQKSRLASDPYSSY